MILATHAVGGAVTALLLRRWPVFSIVAALLSHFVLDAIPHWHYPLRSLHRDKNWAIASRITFNRGFLRDLLVTGLDCGLGVAISLDAALTFQPDHVGLALLGASAGVLPDFLQLIYHILPRPLRPLQKFHLWIHAKAKLNDRLLFGVGSQILLVLCFIALLAWQ